MTPAAFIAKWSRSELRERQGAQSHFIDLCALIGEPTPAEADPSGATYCFERGATKVGGGDGWADVWRRACFGFEYKGKHKDLNAALRQLQIYAPDLENPPYLAVCDMERIIVHTNWTNTVRKTFTYAFDDLREPAKLDELRQVFQGSDRLKPGLSPQELTATVATRFGDLGKRLQERGHEPRAVAHFLNRLIFCLFAEDAELLPKDLFTRMLRNVSYEQYNIPRKTRAQLDALFSIMKEGGFFGADAVRWFNGGLFDEAEALPLERDDLDMLVRTAREHDWSNLDPAILGTMFEAALKTTGRRAALGAHYTDREKILQIVDPVIVRPLAAEWDAALAAIRAEAEARVGIEARREALEVEATAILAARGPEAARTSEVKRRKDRAGLLRERDDSLRRATEARDAFLRKLAAFRVLDPACGSGNFLYVALHALRDIELRALLDADRLGVPQVRPKVGLDAVRGIEIEPYAAELARVTLWVGNLQWERRNGFTDPEEPILSTLDTIECRDALLDPDGGEARWPAADVIVGNPPFLGGKRLRERLGDATVQRLFATYRGRVPAEADFVCYWVAKAWAAVRAPAGPPQSPHGEEPRSGVSNHEGSSGRDEGTASWFETPPSEAPHHEATGAPSVGEGGLRAGLVTTNSIRGGANRRVLEPIAAAGALQEAWSDEAWVLEGAAVRVSMLGFGAGFAERRLNGLPTVAIHADLTGAGVDLTKAARLRENAGVAFMGDTKGGAFDVPGDLAREWLRLPLNPNGRPNSDVLKPWRNAMDVTRRPADKWIVDFGWTMSEAEAALYEVPFQHVLVNVRPERSKNNREAYRRNWWRHVEPRPALTRNMKVLRRTLVTPETSKHRIFAWLDRSVLPDHKLQVVVRDEDLTFGLLQSRFHEIWALKAGSWHGVGNDPRYTISTTFETFPFPEGLTSNIPAAATAADPRAQNIAAAAAALDRLREAWLNPPDLVRIEPEVVPGYPDRVLLRDEAAAAVLRTRTLTALYNARPTWLADAHRALDAAVAAAYGWPADLADDAILARLFALNQERAAAGR